MGDNLKKKFYVNFSNIRNQLVTSSKYEVFERETERDHRSVLISN